MTAPLFPPSALGTLAAANGSSRVRLVVHRGEARSDLEHRLEAVAREVEEGTSRVIASRRGDGSGPPARPALGLAAGEQERIHYLAIPEGLEVPPFLDALMALAEGGDVGTRRLLQSIDRPCQLLVFVAPGCPNCPQAVRAAVTVAAANELVTLSVVDVTAFPELAERHRIRSVPTTIVDDELVLVGVVPARKLARQIASRGSDEHRLEAFASQLAAGRFDQLAQRLAQGAGVSHFTALWSISTMEQRIGLMLVAEQALAMSSRSLDGAVAGLLPVLESEEAALRGDTVDLLARIGHQAVWPALRALSGDPDPDVAEAVADALGS